MFICALHTTVSRSSTILNGLGDELNRGYSMPDVERGRSFSRPTFVRLQVKRPRQSNYVSGLFNPLDWPILARVRS